MSRVTVVDPTNWADRAVGAVRGLVGSAGQSSDGADGPGRWLVVTIYRQAEDVQTQVDGSGPLTRMRDEIELTVPVDGVPGPPRSDPRLFATTTPELELPGPRVGTDAETTAGR